MAFKFIRTNIILFIITYLSTIIFLYTISYNFVINNFLELEEKQNKTNINTLLSNTNSQLNIIQNINKDYAKWDDSYNFLAGKNNLYLYENFREGTSTVKDLNLDFMIYATLENKIVFAKYETPLLNTIQKDFEQTLLKNYSDQKRINTIFRYKENYFYISKTTVSNSDETKESNGYIYMGKTINNLELNNLSKVFEFITLNEKHTDKTLLEFKFPHLAKVKVAIKLADRTIKNNLQIYDQFDNHIVSIHTENKRDIVNNGVMTIIIFNIIMDVFIFIILFILYRNQKNLEKQHDILESKVKRRTNQLNRSLKKLQTKNSELYNLANKDYLTKINNRRSYFMESEKLLKEAIKKDMPLSVLIIDIDNFKQINDQYGHAIGDKILISFCDIVNQIIDETTIFGRIGGEEFCLTFQNITLDGASIIGEKIRKKCESSTLHLSDYKINFTISLGLCDRQNFIHIDEILQQADELLYNAKETGRNRMIRTTIHK